MIQKYVLSKLQSKRKADEEIPSISEELPPLIKKGWKKISEAEDLLFAKA